MMAPTAARRTFQYSDSVSINYEVQGHGATPVVFLHGLAASITTWRDIRGLFPPDRYRLFLIDLKGFGRSSKPRDGGYRPEDQAAVVTSFLEEQQLTQAVLIGHSMGGGIALLICLAARGKGKGDMIGRLVLIDCAAYPQKLPPLLRRLRTPLLGWAMLHLLPVPLLVRFMLLRVFHDKKCVTPERIARYVESFTGRGIDYVFIESSRQLVPEEYARLIPAYRTIGLPVLIIWGRNDRIISLDLGRRLQGDIPGSRLVVIDQCGHNPHEERPGETCGAIRNFLEGG